MRAIWTATVLALTLAGASSASAWDIVPVPQDSDYLSDDAQRALNGAFHQLAVTAGLAVLCHQRNDKWLSDLDDQVAIETPEVAGLTSESDGRAMRAAAAWSTDVFASGLQMAEQIFDDEGHSICAGVSKTPEFKKADALVKKARSGANLKGIKPID